MDPQYSTGRVAKQFIFSTGEAADRVRQVGSSKEVRG